MEGIERWFEIKKERGETLLGIDRPHTDPTPYIPTLPTSCGVAVSSAAGTAATVPTIPPRP